jgi:hypothetical protein
MLEQFVKPFTLYFKRRRVYIRFPPLQTPGKKTKVFCFFFSKKKRLLPFFSTPAK